MDELQVFVAKYGRRGFGLVVREFIARAPTFEGDEELAKHLGKMLGELEDVFDRVG